MTICSEGKAESTTEESTFLFHSSNAFFNVPTAVADSYIQQKWTLIRNYSPIESVPTTREPLQAAKRHHEAPRDFGALARAFLLVI